MADQPIRRIPAADKKTVSVRVRLTRVEAQMLGRLVERFDPPTVAAYLRHVLAKEFDRPLPPPAR